MYPMVFELPSNKSLEEILGKNYQGAVILCFYANWCGPCFLIKPVLEEIVNSRTRKSSETKPTMIRINIDKHHELAERFRVFSIPCVVLVRHGNVVEYLNTREDVRNNFQDMVFKAEVLGLE